MKVSSHSIICLRQALSMEEQQPEEAFAPFAVCLSPILFSEEEDSEYDSLNPADRREDTIVLFRKDISPVYCMSSEESPLLPPNRMYTPDHETYPWKYKYQDTCIRDCSVTDYISDAECKSFSPSCAEAKEESELTHNSPTLLLEISSSSGTTSISEESNFRENDEEQSLDYDALTSTSSDSSSECKCNNCDPQSNGEFKCHESIYLMIPPKYQVAADDFIYKYKTFNEEMIKAAHNLRYPAEVNHWAAEYLNLPGTGSTYPELKNRVQYLQPPTVQCHFPGQSWL
ncbi:uncharacterized protein [Engystomops pustulosus]|uniref:uncharacterized protein isoform X2 n=1 Tax=Engystomops pustulosus TaxID=76066 RepID=UPI003AFAEC20